MRIISQDGLMSIDMNSARIFVSQDAVCYGTENYIGCLGYYKSMERARDVLLELHKQMSKGKAFMEMPEE